MTPFQECLIAIAAIAFSIDAWFTRKWLHESKANLEALLDVLEAATGIKRDAPRHHS
jgi:hypothetical protein